MGDMAKRFAVQALLSESDEKTFKDLQEAYRQETGIPDLADSEIVRKAIREAAQSRGLIERKKP